MRGQVPVYPKQVKPNHGLIRKQKKTPAGCRGRIIAGIHDSIENRKKTTNYIIKGKQKKTSIGCRSIRAAGDDDSTENRKKTTNYIIKGKQKKTYNAQSSLEFLMMLSVALLALLVFFGIAQSEGIGLSTTKIKSEAQNAVNDISSAAEDVYAQGSGARKKIKVTIPPGYEPTLSSVGNRSIRIRAGGNDYVRTVDFELAGNLPPSPGYHDIWIMSEGSRVMVGNAMVSLGRLTINTVMGRNDSRSESFTVKNVWDSRITVNISQVWNNPNVSMGISENDLVLAAGETETLTLTFVSNAGGQGFHSGSLGIYAEDGSGNSENVLLPVNAEVSVGAETRDGPPLSVVPSSWHASISRNSSEAAAFQVCTNIQTSLDFVNFSPSPGVPGEWVGMTEPLLNIGAGTCQIKTLNVSVPGNATMANHSGFVYLSGNTDGEDSIALSVAVGGDTNDSQAPGLDEVAVFPSGRAIYVKNPVAVRTIADDSATGNNPIGGCMVRIDDGAWNRMISSDGAYDEPVETAGFTFYSGFGIGSHTATVNCTDIRDNSALSSTDFKIMKEFLFITENPEPDAEEQAWIDWISNDYSEEGYAWNIDSDDSSAFIAGSPNTSYYSVVIAERWVSGMETRLNSHLGSGGSIVMLGNASGDAPLALGLSAIGGNDDASTEINVLNDTHYITAGYNGVTEVTNSSTEFSLFWKDLGSGLLAKSMVVYPPHWYALGISGTGYFWGPHTPNNLTPVGKNITRRTLDHAVNASSNH